MLRAPLHHSTLTYLCIAIVAVASGAGIGWGTGAWKQHSVAPTTPEVVAGDGIRAPRAMMWVPGGEFMMGSDSRLAKPNERPAHKVRIHGFWMDRTAVTNAQLAAFVAATRLHDS